MRFHRQVWGDDVVWTNGEAHWEIRRMFTLSDYISFLPGYTAEVIAAVESMAQSRTRWITAEYDRLYILSCIESLPRRFSFYQRQYSPDSYRRVSSNFNMKTDESRMAGAFVRAEEPDVIRVNEGTVFSVEDASQAFFALTSKPFSVPLQDSQPLPLRWATGAKKNGFFDYTVDAIGATAERKLFEKKLLGIGVEGVRALSSVGMTLKDGDSYGNYPKSISNKFLFPRELINKLTWVSMRPECQILADNLAQMALCWIIAHEDAHKYMGHLRHFEKLGIHEQDRLFEELTATSDAPNIVNARKAAELEADTCATMRSVDHFFRNGFLGVVTDSLSIETREAIYWGGEGSTDAFGRRRLRSDPFDRIQRLFVMRLLSASAILPLAVFECAIVNNSYTNHSCYPSFVVRALNVMFTVASRAVDVSLKLPQSKVGSFELSFNEFEEFFQRALLDTKQILSVVLKNVNDDMKSKIEGRNRFISWQFDLSAPMLTEVFLACHVQKMAFFPFGRSLGFSLEDFLTQRHSMYQARIETFAPARCEVNASRLEKVEEDIGLAQRYIQIGKERFGDILQRYGL